MRGSKRCAAPRLQQDSLKFCGRSVRSPSPQWLPAKTLPLKVSAGHDMKYQKSMQLQLASAPAFETLAALCKRYPKRDRGFIHMRFLQVAKESPEVMAAARTEQFKEESDAFMIEHLRPVGEVSKERTKQRRISRKISQIQRHIKVWRADT
jgi:hypothetical protein